MAREMKKSEATAAKRRVYFHCVDATDGITAETGEAGGQPQISTNGAAWTNTGIGVLVAIGNGRYYAELTAGALGTAGDLIETRYKSGNTAETVGDSVLVVDHYPARALNKILGLAARGDLVVNSDGTQIKGYDANGDLVVTLDWDDTDTWTATWA
jgi:hypothetical protein